MHTASLVTRCPALALGVLVSLIVVRPVHADTLTLLWDPNQETVTGYAVYIGSQRVDVGNTTSFIMSNVLPGEEYCFTVAAYTTVEGPKSNQVCGYSNRFPTLSNPGNQTATVGQATSLQLAGTDPDGQPISFTATGLPPGLFIGMATGFISGTPTASGTFTVTAKVFDGVLESASQTFTWSVAAAPTADTTAPSISIGSPTSASSYVSPTATMTLGGTASDNVGVTAVSWINDRGGSGLASGTSSWGVPSIGLQVGTNVIMVTARDAAGNQGTDILTVTYTAPDTTAPAVTISSPTSSSTYATESSLLTVAGSASDNVGVVQVSWVNDRGGAGAASGTASWSASGIVLQSGINTITVTARDAASNVSTDVLAVTYTPPDTTAPSVSILGPTSSSSYNTTSSVVTLGGTASDDRGVTAVTWANDRGGSGFSSGTTSWSVASVNLQSGTNVITVWAQDAAGNKGMDTLTVAYTPPDTTAPSVSIAAPTTSSTYSSTSPSIDVAGTAADDVGVAEVAWSNDRGGAGLASGTASWKASAVPLQLGSNVITVVARDAAGNQSSRVLTVSYSTPAGAAPLTLTGSLYSSGRWVKALLQWGLVDGKWIDVYRDGVLVGRTSNDGSHVDSPRATESLTYWVCVSGTSICSNTITLSQP